MRIRTPFLHWLAVLLLLYAQGALAFAPCVSASAAPASAFSDMPEDCAMEFEANLCLAHCQISDQSDAQTQIPALPVLDAVVLRLPYQTDMSAASMQWHTLGEQRATSPPRLVLLCSFNL